MIRPPILRRLILACFAVQSAGVIQLHGPAAPLSIALVVSLLGVGLAERLGRGRAVAAGLATFAMVVMTAVETARADFQPWLHPIAHAIRIALPLALTLSALGRSAAVVQRLLRWAAASVFLGHGLECLFQNPFFVALLVEVPPRILGGLGLERAGLTAEDASKLLYLIGAQDVLLAALLALRPSRPVARYMGFWGFMTASTRLVFFGPAAGMGEFIARVGNGAGPLLGFTPRSDEPPRS